MQRLTTMRLTTITTMRLTTLLIKTERRIQKAKLNEGRAAIALSSWKTALIGRYRGIVVRFGLKNL